MTRNSERRIAEIAARVDRETPDWRDHVRVIEPERRKYKLNRKVYEYPARGGRIIHEDAEAAREALGYASRDSIYKAIDGGGMAGNGSRLEWAPRASQKERAA